MEVKSHQWVWCAKFKWNNAKVCRCVLQLGEKIRTSKSPVGFVYYRAFVLWRTPIFVIWTKIVRKFAPAHTSPFPATGERQQKFPRYSNLSYYFNTDELHLHSSMLYSKTTESFWYLPTTHGTNKAQQKLLFVLPSFKFELRQWRKNTSLGKLGWTAMIVW